MGQVQTRECPPKERHRGRGARVPCRNRREPVTVRTRRSRLDCASWSCLVIWRKDIKAESKVTRRESDGRPPRDCVPFWQLQKLLEATWYWKRWAGSWACHCFERGSGEGQVDGLEEKASCHPTRCQPGLVVPRVPQPTLCATEQSKHSTATLHFCPLPWESWNGSA